ncbi:MAG: Bug family tripartite tricarboxylate transporter substrate binding protein, partial [Burkholderiales bacterium]
MVRWTSVLAAIGIAMSGLAGSPAAQDYPNRPVRMIVPQAAGSGVDLMTRIIAQKLSESWGHPVLVDNRVGANGIIGLEAAAKAKPDGYTMVLGVPSSLTMNPFIYRNLPYNTFRDFAPVIQTSMNTFGMVVNSSLPARSVKDVVALAKAHRGELLHGSFGIGNMTHLAAELFSREAGVKLMHVPFKGESPSVVGLLNGEIALMLTPMQAFAPHVRTGKLRLLATFGDKRSVAFPDVPSIAELGFSRMVMTGWSGILAPAGSPPDIINKVQADVARVLLVPDTRDYLIQQGAEPVASSPA